MTSEVLFEVATDQFAELIMAYSPQNVFLVARRGSLSKSGASTLVEALGDLPVHHFWDFVVNPDHSDVKRGLRALNDSRASIIVAIGGGSAIDMAKLLKFYGSNPGLVNDRPPANDDTSIRFSEIPLVAIPTTAGSGSEATSFAVLYREGIKYSISHPSLLPNVAILNSKLTHSLSPYVTAYTGADALSQAIESYWNIHSTPESIAFSTKALSLIHANLPKAVHSPDEDNRRQLLRGAHEAGKAINVTKTTAPHALSYSLTVKCGLPHGHAVAMCLPDFIQFNYGVTLENVRDPRGVEFVKSHMRKMFDMFGYPDAASCTNGFIRYFGDLGLNVSCPSGFGLWQDHRSEICDGVNWERLTNNPREVTRADVESIFDGWFAR